MLKKNCHFYASHLWNKVVGRPVKERSQTEKTLAHGGVVTAAVGIAAVALGFAGKLLYDWV